MIYDIKGVLIDKKVIDAIIGIVWRAGKGLSVDGKGNGCKGGFVQRDKQRDLSVPMAAKYLPWNSVMSKVWTALGRTACVTKVPFSRT